MKVILTQDVRGQGKRGQMIEVSDGYARNFLLPRKLAQEATADNVNTMKMNDKAAQERQAKERAEALEIRNRMKDMTVVVTAKGGGAGRLFGSVTNTEVADALAKQADVVFRLRKGELQVLERVQDGAAQPQSRRNNVPRSERRAK